MTLMQVLVAIPQPVTAAAALASGDDQAREAGNVPRPLATPLPGLRQI